MARLLDNDPEELDHACITLLRYSEAHAAYRRANAKELKRWGDSSMMRQVETIDAELARREIGGGEG